MSVLSLNRDNFESVITQNPLTLVDFRADWCGPCRVFDEVYHRVAEQFPGVVFGQVDIEKEPELAQIFQVKSIPLLMIFRQNIVVFRESGALLEEGLIDMIQKAQALDLAEVEAQLANK